MSDLKRSDGKIKELPEDQANAMLARINGLLVSAQQTNSLEKLHNIFTVCKMTKEYIESMYLCDTEIGIELIESLGRCYSVARGRFVDVFHSLR